MWLLNLINSDTLSCDRLLEQNLRLYTKCHWNRVIPAWFIAIKLFSRWRPSAILNFWNLVLWSRGLCQNVILLLRTKFSVNRTIYSSDVTKKRLFNVAAVRHFEFAKFWYFVAWPSFGTNLRPCTKLHWNRMIPGWEIAITQFSKWRHSGLLDSFWRHHIASGFSMLCS